MALRLSTERVNELLARADELSTTSTVDEISERHPGWRDDLSFLLEDSTPLTYFPVLCVTLVARMASPEVNVMRIQHNDEYSAALVGRALVRYGTEHQIDVRTSSEEFMNNQPFIYRAEITADMTNRPEYPRFFAMVQKVQKLDPDDAAALLALAFHLGRENWPARRRRQQRNQATAALPPTTSGTTDTVSSFILNRALHGQTSYRDTISHYNFREGVTSANALVDAGSGRFVYYSTSNNTDHPMSFVGHGLITAVDETGVDEEGRRTWVARIADYTPFPHPVPKDEGAPSRWNVQHSIVKIPGTSFDRIIALGTERITGPEPLTAAAVGLACTERGLLLPVRTITTLVAALNSGKHVILTGPPGTAKTTLAVVVSQVAATQNLCSGHLLTTATADWSTYDTIGGLAPTEDNQLAYRPGRFIEALDGNLWLVVDEMNRSNFDRAFGQLFTVLAGTDVTLPYNDSDTGLPIRLRVEDSTPDPRYHDVVVGRYWRMIGTINNFDKSLLFEMSFALMRRFAFVEVPAPDEATYRQLIATNVEDPSGKVNAAATAAIVALLPLRRTKEFGPAIFIDAARMAHELARAGADRGDIVLAVFYALFLPQLEGLEERRGAHLLREMVKACGHNRYRVELIRMLREVLGLELANDSRGATPDDWVSDEAGDLVDTDLLDDADPGTAAENGPESDADGEQLSGHTAGGGDSVTPRSG